jgi:hypothetical protein
MLLVGILLTSEPKIYKDDHHKTGLEIHGELPFASLVQSLGSIIPFSAREVHQHLQLDRSSLPRLELTCTASLHLSLIATND